MCPDSRARGGGRLKGGVKSSCKSGCSSRAGGCTTVGGQWGGGAMELTLHPRRTGGGVGGGWGWGGIPPSSVGLPLSMPTPGRASTWKTPVFTTAEVGGGLWPSGGQNILSGTQYVCPPCATHGSPAVITHGRGGGGHSVSAVPQSATAWHGRSRPGVPIAKRWPFRFRPSTAHDHFCDPFSPPSVLGTTLPRRPSTGSAAGHEDLHC